VVYHSLMKVEIVGCEGLKDADAVGKSDPYVKVKFGDDEATPETQRTHTLQDTLNPVYNIFKFFLVSDECKSFAVDVYDEDVGGDDRIGHCTCLRADKRDRGNKNGGWYALEDGKGKVQVFFTEIDLSRGLEEIAQTKRDALNAAERSDFDLIGITAHDGSGVKGGGFGKPDPYCKIKFDVDERSVCPHKILQTHTCNKTNEPSWNFRFFYLIDRSVSMFECRVMDEDVGADDSLGHCKVIIGDLNALVSSQYALESGKGKIRVSHMRVPVKGLF